MPSVLYVCYKYILAQHDGYTHVYACILIYVHALYPYGSHIAVMSRQIKVYINVYIFKYCELFTCIYVYVQF